MTKINQSYFITLEGAEEYIVIRGVNIKNSLLLILHGGTSKTAHFEKIEVPDKQFISFKKSAHLVPFEEVDRFNEVVKSITISSH